MNTYSLDKMYESYSSEIERMQKCINELKQENKKLNGAIQTYDILLKANTEENKRLKDNWNKLKEVIDRLNFIKNRKNQGASQENINKMAIEFVNNYLKEVSEWK